MHLIDLDARLRARHTSSDIQRVTTQFYKLYQAGKHHGLVRQEIGSAAVAAYHAMERGNLVILDLRSLSSDFEPVRADRRKFELGFAEHSLSSRVITGLLQGSRATNARVENGDQISRITSLFQYQGFFQRNMTLLVGRAGQELEISYWPRSWEKVQRWQWVRRSTTELIAQN